MKNTEMENVQIMDDTPMGVSDLIQLIRYEREEAQRKRDMLIRAGSNFKAAPSQAEIERAGHEHDMQADAYAMVLRSITSRKLRNSVGRDVAKRLNLIDEDEQPIPTPSEKAPVQPKIENPEMQREAEKMITVSEIDESIYEAAAAAQEKSGDEHWETARNKVRHFYAGTEDLPENPTIRDVDNYIKKILKKVRDVKKAELEEEIGLERETIDPITNPEEIQKVQFVKDKKFNMSVLLGGNKGKTAKETEDRIKLIAIHEFTKGNRKRAIQILKDYYHKKNWTDIKAEEFLFALMNKEPHKELNKVIYGVLKYNKDKNNDAREGIRMCRNIVGAYLGLKFDSKTPADKLTNEQKNANKTIDRYVNRQLKELNEKS